MEKRNLRGDSSMTAGAVVLVENKPANTSEHPAPRVFAWLNTRGANAFICHITSTEWKLCHFAILLCRHFRNIATSSLCVWNQATKKKSRNKSPLWQDTTFNTLERVWHQVVGLWAGGDGNLHSLHINKHSHNHATLIHSSSLTFKLSFAPNSFLGWLYVEKKKIEIKNGKHGGLPRLGWKLCWKGLWNAQDSEYALWCRLACSSIMCKELDLALLTSGLSSQMHNLHEYRFKRHQSCTLITSCHSVRDIVGGEGRWGGCRRLPHTWMRTRLMTARSHNVAKVSDGCDNGCHQYRWYLLETGVARQRTITACFIKMMMYARRAANYIKNGSRNRCKINSRRCFHKKGKPTVRV